MTNNPKSNTQKSTRSLSGVAARDSRDKTVSVIVNYFRIHPIYLKRYIVTRKILAHTESEVKKGQKVIIESTRPISRHKAWKVILTKKESQ